MQAIQTQAPKTEQLLEDIRSFYVKYLGYAPQHTSLQQISENKWQSFIKGRDLNPNSSGIYLPRNQTAIVRGNNPLSLFHEYFGHGLYCEQSLQGRKIVDLEQRLLEQEKQEFQARRFSLQDLKRFREQNPLFQELEKSRQQNLATFEGFAVWTEYFLAQQQGLILDFEKKYDSLNPQDQQGLQDIINFSRQRGNLATFYAFGMARKTTPERVRTLLQEIYGSKIQDIKLALLYGSRKEFSDIDVFIVGEGIANEVQSDWLDIREITENQLEYALEVFDISVTDPLYSGEIVLGEKRFLQNCLQKLESSKITQESIFFNRIKGKEQTLLAELYPKNSKKQRIGQGYSKTYSLNSERLSEGRKILTKKQLISHSLREEQKELKGGTEKYET